MIVSEVYRTVTVNDVKNDVVYVFEQTQGTGCTMRIVSKAYDEVTSLRVILSAEGICDLIKALSLIQNKPIDKE